MNISQLAEYFKGQVNNLSGVVRRQEGILNQLIGRMNHMESIEDEIESIPGRRVPYNLNGEVEFTIADNARRGEPTNHLVSQDGPFIWTHQPIAMWRPSAPTTATALGLWRPITTWPLPDQAAGGGQDLDTDLVSISFEIVDAGSQRNFQNAPTPAGVLSYPLQLVPLAKPVLVTPNSVLQFFPTYNRILFNNPEVAPTEGILSVSFPGYRIANM
jgi:hypothetical protein